MNSAKKHPITPYVPPTPAERRAEFLRRLPQGPLATHEEALEVARAFDTEALHEQLDAARARILPGGRKKGRPNKATERVRAHIRELQTKYPKLSAPALYGKADKRIIGKMAKKTFETHARSLDAK